MAAQLQHLETEASEAEYQNATGLFWLQEERAKASAELQSVMSALQTKTQPGGHGDGLVAELQERQATEVWQPGQKQRPSEP